MSSLSFRKLTEASCPEEAMRQATLLLRKYPHNGELIRILEKLLHSINSPDSEFLLTAGRLKSARGRALYIRALVAGCNASEALACYRKYQSDSRFTEALPVRVFAKLLRTARCHEAAEEIYWMAIEQEPDNMELVQECIENLLNLAELAFPEKFSEARELAEFVHERHPADPHTNFAIAQIWYYASRMDRCLPYFREFFKVKPDHAARAGYVFNLNYDEELSRGDLKREHVSWCRRYTRIVRCRTVSLEREMDPGRRLRVGYVSPDLGYHPVGFFAIPVIEKHDTDQVEIFVYSHRDPVARHDNWSRRLHKSVGPDNWRWINKDSNLVLTRKIAADRIDILVDLSGHTDHNRLDAFANRTSPVQVSWLGYPHSTWLPNMDYRLSDSVVEPEGMADEWSSETIYRMPNGFHALEMDPAIPQPSAPPCLVNGYITFGSFNNINKIGTRTIRLWASLLHSIPDSRLLLKHKTMQVLENREGIRSLFAMEGIHPGRISFKGIIMKRQQHFKAYEQVDIALDPYGYNGTTTTCEALYMGVPVLSLPGERHASRVSASLLHRMGLDGWIARDAGHYVRIAKYAAANPGVLASRRSRMRRDFLDSPLADTAGMARDLETAYRYFWRQYCQDGSPVAPASCEMTAQQHHQ